MLRLSSITKKDFDLFLNKQPLPSHFMQSSSWGEFMKVTSNVTPHYLALVDDNNNILTATLLIEEHLPMNNCLLYAPRGFIINYKDKTLFTTFVNKLKDYAVKKNAIAIKINPCINYKLVENTKTKINKTAMEVMSILKETGFKKQQHSKLLNYNYRLCLTKDQKEIEKSYPKEISAVLENSNDYDFELTSATKKDLIELFKLQNNKENDYYETLYDIFSNNDHTKIRLFLGKLHITKTLKNIERNIKRINNQIAIIPIDHLDVDSKERLTTLRKSKELANKQLDKFKQYKLDYGNYLIVNASLVMESNNNAWIICNENNTTLNEPAIDDILYNELIKYYKNNGLTYFNQLNPLSLDKTPPKFGGEYTEYIGEYDLITNHFMYFIHKKILPVFMKLTKEK